MQSDATRLGGERGAMRYAALVGGLSALIVLFFILSLAAGYAPLDLAQAASDAINGRATLASLVLLELRCARAILGALVGFSLGITGAAMQGLLRNPLAEPGITGVSGAAALGAVIVFYFGLAGIVPLALPLGGVAGAILRPSRSMALPGRGRARRR